MHIYMSMYCLPLIIADRKKIHKSGICEFYLWMCAVYRPEITWRLLIFVCFSQHQICVYLDLKVWEAIYLKLVWVMHVKIDVFRTMCDFTLTYHILFVFIMDWKPPCPFLSFSYYGENLFLCLFCVSVLFLLI